MDGTINDFFNEIDQIAPPKEKSEWQECFDETSGFTYYWNVKTDQVTWEMPNDHKPSNKLNNLFVPPKSPLFPSASLSATKIYNIQEDCEINSSVHSLLKPIVSADSNKHTSKPRNLKDSEKKVVLVSSYSDDSGSDNESDTTNDTRKIVFDKDVVNPEHHSPSETGGTNLSPALQTDSSSEDDVDLLTKIQNRAKILKDMGGELPPDVKKLVEKTDVDSGGEMEQKSMKIEKRDVTGFSLLANYDAESDEEEEEKKLVIFVDSDTKTNHSTLFPAPKPIDIKQFPECQKQSDSNSELENLVDRKVFHRKRRIDIEVPQKLSNVPFGVNKKPEGNDVERQGLGFKAESENVESFSKPDILDYAKFKSGGVLFNKTDGLNPVVQTDDRSVQDKEDDDDSKKVTMIKLEITRKTLNEKLTFLSEGRTPVSPVQVMIIQMETLYEAVKAGSLTTVYLQNWLKETCSELIKLEKDAAPSGWLLQWDRTNKRYYYRNQQTGDSQWEYPQPDIVGGTEAMDISTTPPPPPVDDLPQIVVPKVLPKLPAQPPPPPRIRSPTPPPPPTISKNGKHKRKHSKKLDTDPLLLIEIPRGPMEKPNMDGEPLPPGVDSTEIATEKTTAPLENTSKIETTDMLGPALNSFYSDLAALENTTNTTVTSSVVSESVLSPSLDLEVPTKKKKKTRVKIVQGLAMKKKGVSKLVERWKNVQKDY